MFRLGDCVAFEGTVSVEDNKAFNWRPSTSAQGQSKATVGLRERGRGFSEVCLSSKAMIESMPSSKTARRSNRAGV